jgi:hypothetical protein
MTGNEKADTHLIATICETLNACDKALLYFSDEGDDLHH